MRKAADPPQGPYRLPPGQHLTGGFPVLHYGAIPPVDPARWAFSIFGHVEEPVALTLDEIRAMPPTEIVADIHCVTSWSKFDTRWRGVRFSDVAGRARPKPGAAYGLAHALIGAGGPAEDFTTGLPLEAWMDDDVLLAYEYEGEPLSIEHGGPLRLVVPKRYFYKSPKWVTGIEYLTDVRLGFWERAGYSESADPWREERYG